MNQLICEMCGSTDLIKRDGLFVCQSCGVKYSPEEAKKMIIEGTVEIAGTVKVDSSEKLSNLYQIARRAKEDENNENAEKYYEMILIDDPNSWEATFYVTYFQVRQCKVAEIELGAKSLTNCIDTVMNMIDDYLPTTEEKTAAFSEVYDQVINIATLIHSSAENYYQSIRNTYRYVANQQYLINSVACANLLYTLGNQLEELFSDIPKANTLSTNAWKQGIAFHADVVGFSVDKKVENESEIIVYSNKVKKYESTYSTPSINKMGCYIATCVYGSYDCPEVWTLRRYRDQTLSSTWLGRAFIRIYYAISPTLVKWFGNSKWFKKLGQGKLDKMVKKLQAKGFENTPYYD